MLDPQLNAKKQVVSDLYKMYNQYLDRHDEAHADAMKQVLVSNLDTYMQMLDKQLDNPGSDTEHNELRSELAYWNNIMAEVEQLEGLPYMPEPRSMLNPADWEVDREPYERDDYALGGHKMLSTLFKLAYKLDKEGKYDEAKEIEAVMKDLTTRVGLDLDDLVSLANHFDNCGEIALADRFDAMMKAAAKKKTPYKTHKGPGEKKPEGAKHKAPKEWFDKMKKDVKKKNPDWDNKRVSEVVGDIWDNELSDKKREQIYNRAGKKKSPNA